MMKMTKGALLLGTLGLGALGLGIKHKSKYPRKYSYKWISNLTDVDWKIEREHIRKDVFLQP